MLCGAPCLLANPLNKLLVKTRINKTCHCLYNTSKDKQYIFILPRTTDTTNVIHRNQSRRCQCASIVIFIEKVVDFCLVKKYALECLLKKLITEIDKHTTL